MGEKRIVESGGITMTQHEDGGRTLDIHLDEDADRWAVLRAISSMLTVMEDPKEQRAVFNVLSAIRGPDSEDVDNKAASTSLIRGMVFHPDVIRHGGMASRDYDTDGTDEDRRKMYSRENGISDGESRHFVQHVQWAFSALGLTWSEYNPKDKLDAIKLRACAPFKAKEREGGW